jgi:hypothetical protein
MSFGPKTTVALLVAVNLLAGATGGVAIDRAFFRADTSAPAHQKGRFFEMLKKDLQLDDQQTEKVRAILDAYRPECQRILAESKKRIDMQADVELAKLHAEEDAELAKVLRPEQVTRLAEIRRERDKQREKDRTHR